jgi:hypothetical protein
MVLGWQKIILKFLTIYLKWIQVNSKLSFCEHDTNSFLVNIKINLMLLWKQFRVNVVFLVKCQGFSDHIYHPYLLETKFRLLYVGLWKMVQYNGFPNRFSELVRIFTLRLMMTRWRRLCIKFVGTDTIERVIHGNRSYIYRDMLAWSINSRNHIKKMLRYWLLTVGERQNQKELMISKTLPNILSCTWKVLPHQCGLWSCFRVRWSTGIPTSAWNEPNSAWLVILSFGMQHPCLKNNMMISRKRPWTRHWKSHWREEWIPNCRLVMTKESSPMMNSHTGNASSLRWVGGWSQ